MIETKTCATCRSFGAVMRKCWFGYPLAHDGKGRPVSPYTTCEHWAKCRTAVKKR